MDSAEKPHDAKVLQRTRRAHVNITTPGVLRSDAPEKNKKVHNMRRVQRCSEFDCQVWKSGSVVLDVSSGAVQLVCPRVGRRERAVL
ncbi:hypothetical protein ERJ75_001176500 [Trypanosoma vivax]|nr:hypothetical protein ERJ75_001176500 [Trypanosoma vivax]